MLATLVDRPPDDAAAAVDPTRAADSGVARRGLFERRDRGEALDQGADGEEPPLAALPEDRRPQPDGGGRLGQRVTLFRAPVGTSRRRGTRSTRRPAPSAGRARRPGPAESRAERRDRSREDEYRDRAGFRLFALGGLYKTAGGWG